ncbi:MAG: ATP-binding protein [Cyanobacteria bacterium P01_A01_bin.40]
MTQSILCHFLIGLPGSGKSTFARELSQQIPNSVIISTDEIRLRLFGDEKIQDEWNRVEQKVIEQVKLGIDYEQSVIYDATNVRLDWRNSFLRQLQHLNSEWIAWWIKTPVEICKQWNQQRSRQVPNQVIDTYQEYLEQSPPNVDEGFIAVREIKVFEENLLKNKSKI